MDNATILIGFAQIAISLAAFTTIASVVVQISESTSESLLAVRLKTTLNFSMHLVVTSVLPLVTYQLVPDEGAFWRYAAMVSLITASILGCIGLFDQLPKVVKDPKNEWTQTIAVSTCGFMSIATGILAILRDNPAFWYITTLALVLAGTLTMIMGLVLSFPVFDVHRKKAEQRESY